MLKISLDCQFDNFQLQINQALPTDQIIGLFGASGSGKSRLIRQLLGFDQTYQNSCSIQFNQQVWQKSQSDLYLPTSKRGIGYLPQNIDLFPHLNIRNNIFFGLSSATNTSEHKFDETSINEVISQLELDNLLNKFPRQLSGGQQQRAALARAIFAGSQLLLLDEPFSAIGEDHKPKVMRLVKKIQDEQSVPIIFSSHNRLEHAFLTQYLMTFNAGSIIQSDHYHFVSTDINGDFSQQNDAINKLTAKVIKFEKEFSVNCLEINNQKIWAGHKALKQGSDVNLEIRAQDISIFLTNNDENSILNSLKVEVIDFQEISCHQIIIKLALNQYLLIAFITKKSFLELALKKGQNVYAKFKSVSVVPISLN